MENPTYTSRETNLVLQLMKESQIENKPNELELVKEKKEFFEHSYFVLRKFL